VVALTVEKEDGDAWVRNRLGNDEIRCSWWLNGGDGFQGVSSECFGVGGACGRKGSKGENVAVTYKASDGWRRKGKGVRSVLPCGGREEKGGGVWSATRSRHDDHMRRGDILETVGATVHVGAGESKERGD
jgi:hypothetical protein